MSSFTLPPELREFIGSAGDLLREIQSPCTDEKVFFRIVPLTPSADFKYICMLFSDVSERIENFYKINKYILHYYEGIRMKVVVPRDGGSPYRIEGILKIGENIEDEWMLTHVLFELSRSLPDIIISMEDNDGQYMLIEGADFIPDWIEPENSNNRVWIRRGSVLIVDKPKPSKGHLSVTESMRSISASVPMSSQSLDSSFVAPKGFHKMIFSRLNKYNTSITPAQNLSVSGHTSPYSSLLHRATCIVPLKLAFILREFLHYKIVNPSNNNSTSKQKNCANEQNKDIDKSNAAISCSIHTFISILNGNTGNSNMEGKETVSSRLAIFLDEIKEGKFTKINVVFTKALYSKFQSKNNHLHEKYWKYYQSKCALYQATTEKEDKKSFEIGFRLLLAMETLVQRFKPSSLKLSNKSGIKKPSDNDLDRNKLKEALVAHKEISITELDNLLTNMSNNLVISNELDSDKSCYYAYDHEDDGPNVSSKDLWYKQKPVKNAEEEICKSILEMLDDYENIPALGSSSVTLGETLNEENSSSAPDKRFASDNDDWMYLDPQELDQVINRIKDGTNASDSVIDSTAESERVKGHEAFSGIIEGMSVFVQNASDVMGIDNRSRTTARSANKADSGVERAGNISDQEDKPLKTQYNEFVIDNCDVIGLNNSNETIYIDSDDEIEGINDDHDFEASDTLPNENQEFIEQYQMAMDNELFGGKSSILSKTFSIESSIGMPKSPNSGTVQPEEVDPDVHLLSGLIESHGAAMAGGSLGPVEVMLSQMGLEMPSGSKEGSVMPRHEKRSS